MTMMPLIGMSIESVAAIEPIIQSGRSTPTSRAPNTERKICCMIRLRPQVASSVSNGRLYKCRISAHSTNIPANPAAKKASTMPTMKLAANKLGIQVVNAVEQR